MHENEIVTELLDGRKSFLFSSEEPIGNIIKEEQKLKFTEDKNLRKSDKSEGKPTAIDFLKQKNLLLNLNNQIGKSGIVGEENSRLLLFLIIIS